MRVLSYSPSVTVYAQSQFGIYDLSEDVTKVTVRRVTNAESTATVTVANENHKYDGVFLPMDKVAIWGSKSGRQIRMFTGYIKSASVFSLYQTDFELTCTDIIGWLQRKFFDPALPATRDLFINDMASGYRLTDGAVPQLIALLTEVAGLPSNIITIRRELPKGVVDWAMECWSAQQSEAAQSAEMLRQIYDLIGSKVTLSSSTGTTSSGAGTASDETVERAVQMAIDIANDDTHGYSQPNRLSQDYDCSSLVMRCLRDAGFPISDIAATFTMRDVLEPLGFAWHAAPFSVDDLRRGDVLLNILHHTAWYIGGGKMCQASQDENSDIYGTTAGDQTGQEIWVCDYKDYPWDGYLRYEGGGVQ